MDLKKYTAMWMIILIILLPVQFAYALQPFVQVTSISGEADHIEGYRRKTDQTSIKVVAVMGDNTSITPANVQLIKGLLPAPFDFQVCERFSESAGTYICTYTDAEIEDVRAEQHSYLVNLVQGTTLIASTQGYISVDNLAPGLTSLSISGKKVRNVYGSGNLTVSYHVNDFAYLNTDTHKGVGISGFGFWLDNSVVEDKQFNTSVLGYSGSFSIALPGSGTYTLCLDATDAFGLTSANESCTPIVVDLTAPTAIANSLHIINEDGEKFTYVKDKEYNAHIDLLIEADDLDEVHADLSDFSINYDYSDMLGDCGVIEHENYSSVSECTWDISLSINKTLSPRVILNLTDVLGNSNAVTLTDYEIKFDDTGPEVDSFSTATDPYIGGSNSIKVKFTEEGVGMNNTLAYADLSEIGLAPNVQASSCSPSWECIWNISIPSVPIFPAPLIEVSGESTVLTFAPISRHVYDGKQNVRILPSTMDDLENHMLKLFQGNVTLDTSPPSVRLVNITLLPATPVYTPKVVAGDSLHILANLTDASPVTMVVDAQDFINDTLSFGCTQNELSQECEGTIGPISRDGYYKGVLKISFVDKVGNNFSVNHLLEVFEILNQTELEYWTVGEVVCSPNPLSRQISSIIEQKVFCKIPLQPVGDVSTFKFALGACSEKIVQNHKIAAESSTPTLLKYMDLLNDQPGSTTPYLDLLLKSMDPKFDFAEYECKLGIQSIVQKKKITANLEIENVTFRLSLYDEPLGEMSESAQTELDKVYDKYIDSWWKWIGTIQHFLDFASKICSLIDTLGKVRQIWEYLSFFFKGASNAANAIPAGQGAAQTFDQIRLQSDFTAISVGDTWLQGWEILGKFCAFMSCKLWYGDNWAEDIQKAVTSYVNFAYDLGLFSGQGFGWNSEGAVHSGRGQSPGLDKGEKKALESKLKDIKKKAKDIDDSGSRKDYIRTESDKARAEAFAKAGLSDAKRQRSQLDQQEKILNDRRKTLLETGESSSAQISDIDQELVNIAGEKKNIDTMLNGNGIDSNKVPLEDYAKKQDMGWKTLGTLDIKQNPKDSYILSVLTLCIPGIIYNLDKYRQIQCTYGQCVMSTAEGGIPIGLCKDQKEYQTCKYFYGPLFQLIPFAGFLNDASRAVKNLLSNPMLAIDTAIFTMCKSQATAASSSPFSLGAICIVANAVDLVIDIKNDIKSYTDKDFWKLGGADACTDFKDEYEKAYKGKNETEKKKFLGIF